MAERSWARLRWRCRRGMLENDLILTRYLDSVAGNIGEREIVALDRLLDMNDNELWDLLSGRIVVEDVELQDLVRQLRGV